MRHRSASIPSPPSATRSPETPHCQIRPPRARRSYHIDVDYLILTLASASSRPCVVVYDYELKIGCVKSVALPSQALLQWHVPVPLPHRKRSACALWWGWRSPAL